MGSLLQSLECHTFALWFFFQKVTYRICMLTAGRALSGAVPDLLAACSKKPAGVLPGWPFGDVWLGIAATCLPCCSLVGLMLQFQMHWLRESGERVWCEALLFSIVGHI